MKLFKRHKNILCISCHGFVAREDEAILQAFDAWVEILRKFYAWAQKVFQKDALSHANAACYDVFGV